MGVDLSQNKRILFHDVNEKAILEKTRCKKAKIIVTPIGSQGFIFGGENQQISSSGIKEIGIENIILIFTRSKIVALQVLRVDIGYQELDLKLRGYIKVITGYKEEYELRVE